VETNIDMETTKITRKGGIGKRRRNRIYEDKKVITVGLSHTSNWFKPRRPTNTINTA
jgi:hypothetical protein